MSQLEFGYTSPAERRGASLRETEREGFAAIQEARILDLLQKHPHGLTSRSIASALRMERTSVTRAIRGLTLLGQIDDTGEVFDTETRRRVTAYTAKGR